MLIFSYSEAASRGSASFASTSALGLGGILLPPDAQPLRATIAAHPGTVHRVGMDHPDRGSSGGRRAAPATGLGRPAGISQLAGRGVRGALFGVYPDHTLLYRLRAAGGLLGMGHPPILPP